MKIKITLIVFLCLFFVKNSTAQISIPSDSLKSSLCHKWGFKSIIMAGKELSNMNESITYEFFSDNTFKRITSKGEIENGSWKYEQENKRVHLKIKKTHLYISSLTQTELVISLNDSKDDLGIATVLKLIGDN